MTMKIVASAKGSGAGTNRKNHHKQHQSSSDSHERPQQSSGSSRGGSFSLFHRRRSRSTTISSSSSSSTSQLSQPTRTQRNNNRTNRSIDSDDTTDHDTTSSSMCSSASLSSSPLLFNNDMLPESFDAAIPILPQSDSSSSLLDPSFVDDDQYQPFYDIADTIDAMKHQEVMDVYRRSSIEKDLKAVWRKMLIEWMYYVVDFCSLQRQSVAAASFFLDVCMTKGLCTTREEHQLAAATSLQTSLKLFDSAVIKLEKLVKLGRGQFTEQDVASMERKLLATQKWHIHPPSVYCFMRQYEQFIVNVTPPAAIVTVVDHYHGNDDDVDGTFLTSMKTNLNEMMNLLAELTVVDESYVTYTPSTLAYAIMLVAMEYMDDELIDDGGDDNMVGQDQVDRMLPTLFVAHHRVLDDFVRRMSVHAKVQQDDSQVVEAMNHLKRSLEDNQEKLTVVLQKMIPLNIMNDHDPYIDHDTIMDVSSSSASSHSSRIARRVRCSTSTTTDLSSPSPVGGTPKATTASSPAAHNSSNGTNDAAINVTTTSDHNNNGRNHHSGGGGGFMGWRKRFSSPRDVTCIATTTAMTTSTATD